jgi:hypothetical protein
VGADLAPSVATVAPTIATHQVSGLGSDRATAGWTAIHLELFDEHAHPGWLAVGCASLGSSLQLPQLPTGTTADEPTGVTDPPSGFGACGRHLGETVAPTETPILPWSCQTMTEETQALKSENRYYRRPKLVPGSVLVFSRHSPSLLRNCAARPAAASMSSSSRR